MVLKCFLKEDGQPNLVTSKCIFSTSIYQEVFTIYYQRLLGRSFMDNPEQNGCKLVLRWIILLGWKIRALIVSVPDTKYFFNPRLQCTYITMQARRFGFGFITKFFSKDVDKLVYPIDPFHIALSEEQINHVFVNIDYDEGL